jgi:hypothetical protein
MAMGNTNSPSPKEEKKKKKKKFKEKVSELLIWKKDQERGWE